MSEKFSFIIFSASENVEQPVGYLSSYPNYSVCLLLCRCFVLENKRWLKNSCLLPCPDTTCLKQRCCIPKDVKETDARMIEEM